MYLIIPKEYYQYSEEGTYYIKASYGGYPYESDVRIDVVGLEEDSETPGFEIVLVLLTMIFSILIIRNRKQF